nr:protein phosphatase 2C 51-like [Coffea arabica]
MRSHLDGHKTSTTKGTLLAKKARKARRKRLQIRRMMTAGLKPPLHFSEDKDACSCARKRSFDYKVATSKPNEAPADEDVSLKDKKLKGAAGNRSGDLGFSGSASKKSPAPGDGDNLPEGEVGEKEGVAGEVEDRGSMTRLICGSVSVIGRRRVMEDALTVAPGIVAGQYEFFAVYDGHGGARVANACRDRMHHLVEKELQANTRDKVLSSENESGVDWSQVMTACFLRMDEQVVGVRGLEVGEAERAVGSTAVVVMVGPEELVVANCGDSRAVLCRGGRAMALSNDHKPDRPDEKERVEAAGGRIIDWDGCRVQGVLATSRSIGDHYLKPYVISEPEVKVCKRTESDDFLIIATDGLWDVVPNDVACEVVRRCLNGQISKRLSKEPGAAAEAAAILAQLAIAKGSRDNISIIVVDLKQPTEQQSFH